MGMSIVMPIVVMGGIGVISGAVLSLAAKFMSVPVDERVEQVRGMLPGANCGACGFAGCDEYAENLVFQGAKTNLCTPGGAEVAQNISGFLGADFDGIEEKMAVVHCSGTCENTGYAMDYEGPRSCEANNYLFQGRRSCSHACLGYGDCVKVCQYDAIYLENGIAYVDPENCTACGMCVQACPNNLITVVAKKARTFVGCHSSDKGAFVRKICSAGCIGCKLCEKKCEYGAIVVTDNLASIDPSKCTNCGECVGACPTKVIKQVRV